jgi:GMP reductase
MTAKVIDDVKLDYSDVMLVPRCNPDGPASRQDVNLLARYMGKRLLENSAMTAVPIIAANMDGVGTIDMCRKLSEHNMLTALHKHHTVDELTKFYIDYPHIASYAIYSMGANQDDLVKYREFDMRLRTATIYNNIVCIDVANGYTKETADFIKSFRKQFGGTIIAGNVVTREGVRHLWEAGANVIKIGIGPGSVCTTRKLTGIGYPQFSAILECVKEADHILYNSKTYKKPLIIADGGITCPGDIAKGLAAGADYVMVGGLFAGHDEGGGKRVMTCAEDGTMKTTHMKFYGMASKAAQDKHNGGVAEYRASEGKEVYVPYRGSVNYTCREILGGLRSSCTLQGVSNIDTLKYGATFIKVNRQLNNVFGA